MNNLKLLDILTILSFVIGLYAIELAKENLIENRVQSKDSKEILDRLESHLKQQDEILNKEGYYEDKGIYIKNRRE